MLRHLLITALLLSTLSLANASDDRIIGVWLNRHLMQEGEARIVQFLDTCSERGITHVMPNFWFHGYLIYPGSTLAPQHPDFCGWDPMDVVVREAHARNIRVWPWSEYGFFTHYNRTLEEEDCGWILTHHPDWKVRDKDGRSGLINENLGVMHFSMNPAVPEARRFLIDLHLDLARRYDIDGINTDRVRYMNTEWGYGNITEDIKTRTLTSENFKVPEKVTFDMWRQWIITTFAVEFAETWRAEFPTRPISAAVNPPYLHEEKFQHFDQWAASGALDVAVPMIYGNTELFTREITKTKEMLPGETRLLAGIDAGNPEALFSEQVNAAFEAGASGVVVWNDPAWEEMTYSFPAPAQD